MLISNGRSRHRHTSLKARAQPRLQHVVHPRHHLLGVTRKLVLCRKGVGKVGLWYLRRDPHYRDPDDDSDVEPEPARVETEESKKTL